jgi:hypothetical protein
MQIYQAKLTKLSLNANLKNSFRKLNQFEKLKDEIKNILESNNGGMNLKIIQSELISQDSCQFEILA